MVGKVTVPGGGGGGGDLIKEPALRTDELHAHGTPKFSTKRFTGPLFNNGPTPQDVQQGQIGDCYFPSAMAALAQNNAEAIQNMIKENGDGTYTVVFKERRLGHQSLQGRARQGRQAISRPKLGRASV